jgi:alpha-beta hydrolase superfamily lysophospholipase
MSTIPIESARQDAAGGASSPVARLQASEHTLKLRDGTELFYRTWLPADWGEDVRRNELQFLGGAASLSGAQGTEVPSYEPTAGRPQSTEAPYYERARDSAQAAPRRAIFLFHRGHEHSGRFEDIVPELARPDTAFFAWDARGHGRSPGPRGWAPSFATIVQDVDEFVRRVASQHGISLENIFVLGHSVAAVAVAAWVHDYAPPIRGMVLVTPALRVKLYVPLAIPGLRVWRKLRGDERAFVKSYVKSTMLTHDREQARRYDEDPLIARSIAVNILLDLHDTSTRLLDDAAAIRVPSLVLAAGKSDWVVRLDAQQRFFQRLGSPVKRWQAFDGMHHDILHEAERARVFDCIGRFCDELREQPAVQPLLDADRAGYTKDEYDRLRRPLAALSPKRWWYAAQRGVMKTFGQLSDGIRLGWQTGFDSGQSLDYIYENRARGSLLVGWIIDRVYLNAIGWRGIRLRRQHLQKLLHGAIDQTRASGRPVRILDIAAGCGRYVLETLADLPPGTVESVRLHDNVPANLAAGKELADALARRASEGSQSRLAGNPVCSTALQCGDELQGSEAPHYERSHQPPSPRIDFVHADAFDEAALAAIEPAPTIAIVSGLYELFPDNACVLGSLRGVAAAMREGGLLIYTGQPWHPQVEMIARVLTNRDGQPWIMRRRTQQELDDLVRAAGFEKLGMEIDPWGIFTVTIARIAKASAS